jgi:hypothetical protein
VLVPVSDADPDLGLKIIRSVPGIRIRDQHPGSASLVTVDVSKIRKRIFIRIKIRLSKSLRKTFAIVQIYLNELIYELKI